MLSRDRWLLPEGIDEMLSEESRRMEVLRRRILDLFATWGYELVIPPLIEYMDSLLAGTSPDLDRQTFKLIDPASGRLLGVRADMTPQVARIDARSTHRGSPTRLCYLGTVLHAQPDHLARSRSPMQVGAELFGHSGPASDLEVIHLMLDMLAVSGVRDVHLDLGHVGIYRGLARQAGLTSQQEAELFEILQRKDRAELNGMLASLSLDQAHRDNLLALIDLNGHDDVPGQARSQLTDIPPDVLKALDDLEGLQRHLKARFPHLPLHFDLAELRAYHYQTGVVFAAFVPGCGREIARGGRYDQIGSLYGRARPATGFSADLRIILKRLPEETASASPSSVFAPCCDDPDLHETVRLLRGQGKIVIQGLPDQEGGALQMGCTHELVQGHHGWEIIEAGPGLDMAGRDRGLP